jgi:hypothetical protein
LARVSLSIDVGNVVLGDIEAKLLGLKRLARNFQPG